MAVAGMIIVNNPGSWADVHWPFVHAAWHGLTPADLIFPTFLFAVGLSIGCSSLSSRQSGRRIALAQYVKIVRRAGLLFLIGVLLANFPSYDVETLRVTGVLQRIAVCYFIAAIFFLNTGWLAQASAVAAVLVGYFFLMTFSTVPGCDAGSMNKECNVASYVDRIILGTHAGAGIYDPEGVLSTIPAVATTLGGLLAGRWLQAERSNHEKIAWLIVAGLLSVAAGLAWHPFFPINKTLWSSSYVLTSGGGSLLLLASLYHLAKVRLVVTPVLVLGANALVAYTLSELGRGAMTIDAAWLMPHPSHPGAATFQTFVHERLLIACAEPKTASLLYAHSYLLIVLVVTSLLYRSRIYVRL
jgi:predicted acyltransferase